MKTNTFSIVIGTGECQARCPYCCSKMTCTDKPVSPKINVGRLHTACRIVEQARDGLVSVLLTGKGEPLLFPREIGETLREIKEYNFPLIDLQTNGIFIEKRIENLKRWAELGLNTVCISIAHHDPKCSNKIMGIKENFDYRRAVELLHSWGFSVRLNLTMTTSCCSTSDILTLIERCRAYGVEQLTIREVTVPISVKADDEVALEAAAAAARMKPVSCGAKKLRHFFEMEGATPILELPHGGIIYDFDGQNLCLGNCLTESKDPNDIRQIIFFPDGRIAYSWTYPGARLL